LKKSETTTGKLGEDGGKGNRNEEKEQKEGSWSRGIGGGEEERRRYGARKSI
jgi:hypothetical protein